MHPQGSLLTFDYSAFIMWKLFPFLLALSLLNSCAERLDRAAFSTSVVEVGLYEEAPKQVKNWRAAAEALLPKNQFSNKRGVTEEIRFWYTAGLTTDYVVICRKFSHGWEAELRTQKERPVVKPMEDWPTFIAHLRELNITQLPDELELQQKCQENTSLEGWSYRIDVITEMGAQSETYFVPEFFVDCHPEYPRILAAVNLFKKNFSL